MLHLWIEEIDSWYLSLFSLKAIKELVSYSKECEKSLFCQMCAIPLMWFKGKDKSLMEAPFHCYFISSLYCIYFWQLYDNPTVKYHGKINRLWKTFEFWLFLCTLVMKTAWYILLQMPLRAQKMHCILPPLYSWINKNLWKIWLQYQWDFWQASIVLPLCEENPSAAVNKGTSKALD